MTADSRFNGSMAHPGEPARSACNNRVRHLQDLNLCPTFFHTVPSRPCTARVVSGSRHLTRRRIRRRPQLVKTLICFFWPAVRTVSVRDHMKRLASATCCICGADSSSICKTRRSVGLHSAGGFREGACARSTAAAALLGIACLGLDCFERWLSHWRCQANGTHDCQEPCGHRTYDNVPPRSSDDAERWLRAARSAVSNREVALNDWHIHGPHSC